MVDVMNASLTNVLVVRFNNQAKDSFVIKVNDKEKKNSVSFKLFISKDAKLDPKWFVDSKSKKSSYAYLNVEGFFSANTWKEVTSLQFTAMKAEHAEKIEKPSVARDNERDIAKAKKFTEELLKTGNYTPKFLSTQTLEQLSELYLDECIGG